MNYIQDTSNGLTFFKPIVVNGIRINFEADSGAAYSLISKKTMTTLFINKVHLFKYKVKLQTFTKENLTILGKQI